MERKGEPNNVLVDAVQNDRELEGKKKNLCLCPDWMRNKERRGPAKIFQSIFSTNKQFRC